jgi:hypothetical protein
MKSPPSEPRGVRGVPSTRSDLRRGVELSPGRSEKEESEVQSPVEFGKVLDRMLTVWSTGYKEIRALGIDMPI